jgi:hypothetical protein
MDKTKLLKIEDDSNLLDVTGLQYKEFQTSRNQIKFYTLKILQTIPIDCKETALLTQQVTELLLNAAEHGNHWNETLLIKVWYGFTATIFRLIVQDQGTGFRDIERWNQWNLKRDECIRTRNFREMENYIGYRPMMVAQAKNGGSGGISLFGAVEYWDGGIVFSSSGNCIGVKKEFAAVY